METSNIEMAKRPQTYRSARLCSATKPPQQRGVFRTEADPHSWQLPEHDLLTAMVERACIDLWSEDRLIRAAAQRWMLSDRIYPFSFLWVAAELQLSQETVRRLRLHAVNPGVH